MWYTCVNYIRFILYFAIVIRNSKYGNYNANYYPICSNLTSFNLSYALEIHGSELIKLICHYKKLQ